MKKLPFIFAVLASVSTFGAARAEIINVPFSSSSPIATTSSYSGVVKVTVSGTGQSDGTALNDAFYVFTDQSGTPITPDDHIYYDLGYGSGGSASSIDYYLSPIPAYNPTHYYTFNLNTGLSTPAPLDFDVVDDIYSDNSGSFTISIDEAGVPEPATWTMLLVGIGGLGGAMRLRRRALAAEA